MAGVGLFPTAKTIVTEGKQISSYNGVKVGKGHLAITHLPTGIEIKIYSSIVN
jgi:hypothetical protein